MRSPLQASIETITRHRFLLVCSANFLTGDIHRSHILQYPRTHLGSTHEVHLDASGLSPILSAVMQGIQGMSHLLLIQAPTDHSQLSQQTVTTSSTIADAHLICSLKYSYIIPSLLHFQNSPKSSLNLPNYSYNTIMTHSKVRCVLAKRLFKTSI